MPADLTRAEYDAACTTLGIPPSTDEATAHTAYWARVREVHPDKTGTDGEEIRKVNAAWETLKSADFKRPPSALAAGFAAGRGAYRATSPTNPFWGGSSRTFVPGRKANVELPVTLSLSHVLFGGVLRVSIPLLVPCPDHRPTGAFTRCQTCGGSEWIQNGSTVVSIRVHPGHGINQPITIQGAALQENLGAYGQGIQKLTLVATVDPHPLFLDNRVYTYSGSGFNLNQIIGIPYPQWLLGGPIPIVDPYEGTHTAILPPGEFLFSEDANDAAVSLSLPVAGAGIRVPNGGGAGTLTLVALPAHPLRNTPSPLTDRMRALLWALQAELVPGTVIPDGIPRIPEARPKRARKRKKKTPPTPPKGDPKEEGDPIIDVEVV